MSFDIYGQPLRRGHCEVHPHVHEEYPCSVCVAESRAREQEGRCMGGCESEHYLGQAQEHIEHLNARIAELEAQVRKQGLALEKMAAEFGMKGKDEDAHHPVFAYFAAAEECRKEARRLRGEGEA